MEFASRNMFGPIRERPAKLPEYEECGRVLEVPSITFKSRERAEGWAEANGAESCFFHHRWEVVQLGNKYAVGVFNSNTGEREGWAE